MKKYSRIKSTVRIVAIILMAAIPCTGCGKDSKDYYKEACKASKEENFEDAKQLFEQAIKEDSQKAEYYIDYGFTLIKMGEYEDAITQFNKTILKSEDKLVDPDNLITRRNNKMAYRGKAIAYYENHDYEEAITYFQYALEIKELTDLNTDIRKYLSASQKSFGDYEGAIKVCNELISEDKDDAYSYANRAVCYAALGKYEDSLEDFDKAISLESDNYSFYFDKYNMCVAWGNESEAKDVIEGALSINDVSDKSKLYQGKLYYVSGDYDRALTCLNEAYDKGFGEAGYYIGMIYANDEEYEKAKEYLTKYIETPEGKKSADSYMELAKVCVKEKKYNDALKYINTALKFNNVSVKQSLLYYEVAAYEGLGDFNTAYEKAINYLKDYPKDDEMKKEIVFLETRIDM